MEHDADRDWTAIRRLIEAEKEAAWDRSKDLPLFKQPARPAFTRRQLRLSAAVLTLLVMLGMGLFLLSTRPDRVEPVLTMDQLPLFRTLNVRKTAPVVPVALSPLKDRLSELLAQQPETTAPEKGPCQSGDPVETRNRIQRIIRENTLERFLTRVATIHQEV